MRFCFFHELVDGGVVLDVAAGSMIYSVCSLVLARLPREPSHSLDVHRHEGFQDVRVEVLWVTIVEPPEVAFRFSPRELDATPRDLRVGLRRHHEHVPAIEHELLQSCSLRGEVLARHEHGGGSFEVQVFVPQTPVKIRTVLSAAAKTKTVLQQQMSQMHAPRRQLSNAGSRA